MNMVKESWLRRAIKRVRTRAPRYTRKESEVVVEFKPGQKYSFRHPTMRGQVSMEVIARRDGWLQVETNYAGPMTMKIRVLRNGLAFGSQELDQKTSREYVRPFIGEGAPLVIAE